MLKVINLYAGPGAGKSTTAAGLFFMMKSQGYKVELVTEYAKEKVYDGHFGCLSDQMYIFGKQQRRQKKLIGQVDYIITDSPLLLSILYNKELSETFNTLVLETYNSYENINFFINRVKEYKKYGREQTEDEARELDQTLYKLLSKYDVQYNIVDGNITAPKMIMELIKWSNE